MVGLPVRGHGILNRGVVLGTHHEARGEGRIGLRALEVARSAAGAAAAAAARCAGGGGAEAERGADAAERRIFDAVVRGDGDVDGENQVSAKVPAWHRVLLNILQEVLNYALPRTIKFGPGWD